MKLILWSLWFLPLVFTFPSSNNVPSFQEISSIVSKPLGQFGKGSAQIDEEITAEDRKQFQAMLKRQKRSVELPQSYRCNEILDDNDRKRFAELINEQSTRSKRNALNYPLFKWPNNVLYYQFDKAYNAQALGLIRKSIAMLQDVTCVNFVESSTNYDRVMVWKGGHCNSEIGRKTGTQPLSLGDTCLQESLIVHEFIHALGFIHTQTSPNRDQYLNINTDGLSETVKANFQKIGLVASYTPYDYGSIMHYAANAFSQSVPTMVPKDARFIHTMGSQWMSFNDKLAISKHYNCSGRCDAKTAAKCENGGFPHPRNCAKCICPAGYGGNLCNERPAGCGATVEAKEYWQDLKYTVKPTDNDDKRSPYGFCNHWIKAPAGTKIQVRVRSQKWFPGVWDDQDCSYGCTRIGVEIKVDSDKQATNPRICCSTFFGDFFNSSLNPTPIISHTFREDSSFHLDYRYVSSKTPSSGPVIADAKCSDSILYCPERVMRGFCEDESLSLIERRKQCGMSCNLCIL